MTLKERSVLGDAILIKLLQLLQEGRGSEAEAAFDRFLPSDVIQTEHILIVAAARQIGADGETVSLDGLRARIARTDPAGFIGDSLDQLLRKQLRNDFDLEACMRLLIEGRALSGDDRQTAAQLANGVLEGRVAFGSGLAALNEIGLRCSDRDRMLFAPFGEILSMISELIVAEPVRRYWNPGQLLRKEAELRAYEAKAFRKLRRNLKIIASWGQEK